MNKLVRFLKDESGATAIEYGLIAAATGLALVAVMPVIGTALSPIFGTIGSSLTLAAGGWGISFLARNLSAARRL